MNRESRPFGGIDVLIVTTAKGEDEAVRAVGQGAHDEWEVTPRLAGSDSTVWTRTYRSLQDEPIRVLLAPAPATGFEALTALVDCCHPQCVALCGTCTGRPGVTELGDVIVADQVYRCEADQPVRGTGACQPELTDYRIPTAWKYAAQHLELAPDSGWANPPSRSEEEQRQWLLTELGAGRDPLATPDWEQYCPQWDKVLESLWAGGLLEPDLVELSPKGVQAAKRLASLPPKAAAPLAVPRVHVGAVAAGSSLKRSERIWEEIEDRQRLLSGLDLDGQLLGFVGWASELLHVVVKGVTDLGEPGRKQRSKTFASRAAAEVLLELLRTVMLPAQPSAEDVLSTRLWLKTGHHNPASLLDARRAVVPFQELGQERNWGELEAWCADERPLSARAVVGPAGSGKTRLFMQWTHQLRRMGWAAGFLREKVTPAELGTILGESRPVLVVLDDAADRPGLPDLLALLLGSPTVPPKLRIVLLEREAGDWWESLQRHAGITALLAEHEPLVMAPLEPAVSERLASFRAAAAAYGQRLGRPAPEDPTIDLTESQFGTVLGIHMAALADVLELGLESGRLREGIVAQEIRAWGAVCKLPGAEAEESLESASRFAAAVTLLGGVPTLDEAESLRERVKGPRHARFVEGFASVYSGVSFERGAVGPVEPAWLGEALVSQVLAEEPTPESWLATVFLGAEEASLQHGLGVVGRVAADWRARGRSDEPLRAWVRTALQADPEARALPALCAALALGATDAAGIIGPVLTEVLRGSNLAALAIELEPLIPPGAASLLELGAWALQGRLEQPLDAAERARVSGELGDRLSRLEQREPALAATRQAVALWRELAANGPAEFGPELAPALRQLGLRLSEVGQRQEAATAVQQAAEVYRQLVAERPGMFHPYLAASLGDLGRLLGGIGERESALAATEEATALYRQLSESQPDTFSSCLATSLSDLGRRLNELGQPEAALGATEEAARIRRELASVWPETFLPELAATLNNLGKLLTDLGQREAAVLTTQEAVAIRRELARQRPDVFVPALALSLNNLGANLRRLGQREAALEALTEAVALYEKLAEEQPAAYEPKLAMARKNLRNLVERAGTSSAPPPASSPPPSED